MLKNIKERKVSELEQQDAGKAWADLDFDRIPPCVLERGGFMRARGFDHRLEHAYRTNAAYRHFDETTQHMPAYSTEATPFRWMMRSESQRYAHSWDIELDQQLETRADELLAFSSNWVQDRVNQLALLDSFFSAIEPRRSLVFFYAKDVPLLEERAPGTRVLVGAGFIDAVSPAVEWAYKADGPMRSVMWDRAVSHSVRPPGTDGFLLPYQRLFADPKLQGTDLSPFVAVTSADHFDEFSFVSEHVGHDGAIAALMELARVLDLLAGVVDGPWDLASAWIADRLAETWHARGPYPGMGPMLAAAGLERGPAIAHRVLQEVGEDAADPWPALDRAIGMASAGSGPAAGLVGRTARKAWERLAGEQECYRALRLMSRFALTAAQARRLFDGESIGAAEALENPYRLFEVDRGFDDSLSIETVDRGLFPADADARAALAADPIPDPIAEAGDDRRVRAAAVRVLERAAQEGHTVLDEPRLRERLAKLPLRPICDPPTAVLDLAAEEFAPVLVQRDLAAGRGRGWQLDRLAEAGARIAEEVRRRVAAGPRAAQWPWRELIDEAIGQPLPVDSDLLVYEERAREEKAEALRVLARSRVAALVGPAGTGKTTMLKALGTHPDVKAGGLTLLAPTGKARIQLGDKVTARAQTLAQFLRGARWDLNRGYRMATDAPVNREARTVIVDEASMLTEEMLAALLDGVGDVDRLVLCGDPRQLPPIGAGRPFADLLRYLREEAQEDGQGGGVAELTVGRRQLPLASAPARGRDDVAVSSLFSIDAVLPGADEALARVLDGRGDGTIEVITWGDESDLHRKLVDYLCSIDKLDLAPRDSEALKRSFGASSSESGRAQFEWGSAGRGAENWQILTPVRARSGGVAGLNETIRQTWRPGDARVARTSFKLPAPMGADGILFSDKVMCLSNSDRIGAYEVESRQERPGRVANGEIGLVVWSAGKKGRKPSGLRVEFSTQPGVQYTFWESQLNGGGERETEMLELAYAVTIHKAQGSQFDTTFVVIPDPCPLLSPELLYTALTRHQDRLVLLVQGEGSALRANTSPSRSETARRLTCLFRPADPFATVDGTVVDAAHAHRTANGELVRSKSEVIVANTLRGLGVSYGYEELLTMSDGTSRLPDFTILRVGEPPVFWEHLGMLDRPGYRAAWEAKRQWYAEHGIHSHDEGGGPGGVLVCSIENQNGRGIDALGIELLAREVFGVTS